MVTLSLLLDSDLRWPWPYGVLATAPPDPEVSTVAGLIDSSLESPICLVIRLNPKPAGKA